MALSGTDSLFAISKQPAGSTNGFGNIGVASIFVDAIAPGFAVAENTKVRRSHIGQSPYERGAYKVGVGAPISATFEATPNIMGTILNLALGKVESGDWFNLKLSVAPTTGNILIWISPTVVTLSCAATDFAAEIKTKFEASTLVNVGANPTRRVIVNKIDDTNYNIGFINQPTLAWLYKTDDVLQTHLGTVTLTDVAGGAHLIRLDPAAKYAIPWFTAWRSIGTVLKEVALNGKVASLDMIFAGQDAVIASMNGAALNPRRLDQGSSDPVDSLPTPTYDTTPVLTVMDGSHATITIGGVKYGSRATSPIDVLGARLRFMNNLTPMDERYRVGSKFPAGLDVLSRGTSVELSTEFADAALYDALLYSANEWNAQPITGSVTLAATTSVAPGSVQHVLQANLNNVLFSAQSVVPQPRQLIRAALTATSLSTGSTQSEVEFYLFNEATSI
jgi:hypothetical protein